MSDRGHFKPADFERLGDLLVESYGAAPAAASAGPGGSGGPAGAPGGSAPDPARQLALIWPDVVGEEVAANSRPVQLKQGRLVVSVSSSAWAQTLQFMGEAIVVRLNERLGEGTVRRVVFRHAGWEERPRARPSGAAMADDDALAGRAAPLSPEHQAALAGVARLGLSPGLEEKITSAMRAAFVRGQQDSGR